MRENMRFCHVAHSMKRIEIFLNHVRDKNKFKNKDSLFLLVQMFQDYFLLHFLFNVLRLLFLLFGSMFQDFSSLSHIKKLFAFLFILFTSTP